MKKVQAQFNNAEIALANNDGEKTISIESESERFIFNVTKESVLKLEAIIKTIKEELT